MNQNNNYYNNNAMNSGYYRNPYQQQQQHPMFMSINDLMNKIQNHLYSSNNINTNTGAVSPDENTHDTLALNATSKSFYNKSLEATTATATHSHYYHISGPGFMSEESDEGCLINLIILLSSLPNHRPTVEIAITLIWLLSEIEETVCLQLLDTSKKNTFLYNSFSKLISHSLNIVTNYTNDRSGSDEIMKKEKILAEEHLKSWYTEHFKIFEKSIPMTVTDLESSFSRINFSSPKNISHAAGSPTQRNNNNNNNNNTVSSSGRNHRKLVSPASSRMTMTGPAAATADTTPNSYEPRPPSGTSRPSTAAAKSQHSQSQQTSITPLSLVFKDGYRPVTSGPLQALDKRPDEYKKKSSSSMQSTYPVTSVSPGHLKSVMNNNNNNNSMNNSSSFDFDNMYNWQPSYNDDTATGKAVDDDRGGQEGGTEGVAATSKGFESVLVKVLSHHGMDAFLMAMKWTPPSVTDTTTNMTTAMNTNNMTMTTPIHSSTTSPVNTARSPSHHPSSSATATSHAHTHTRPHRAQLDFHNTNLLLCSNRITRCKHTENTSDTEGIYDDIGNMVNKSLRAFGHGELVDDILEVPGVCYLNLYVISLLMYSQTHSSRQPRLLMLSTSLQSLTPPHTLTFD